MIFRLLPTYIYLFMEAQNAQPFHSNLQTYKGEIVNNYKRSTIGYFYFTIGIKLFLFMKHLIIYMIPGKDL